MGLQILVLHPVATESTLKERRVSTGTRPGTRHGMRCTCSSNGREVDTVFNVEDTLRDVLLMAIGQGSH